MGSRIAGVFVLFAAFLVGGSSVADDTSGDPIVVVLQDGSRLVGAVVTEDNETVIFRTTSGLELKLARADITSRGPAPAVEASAGPDIGKPALSDPNDTRLLFAPTGRPLRKGDGYFSDHYVLFPGMAYGLTDHVSVSGGVSVIPSLGFDEQLFYVSSSVGWRFREKAAFSLGGLYATGDNEAGALFFGVASFGPSDRSLSLGLGLATIRDQEYYYDDRGNYVRTESSWSFRDAPVLMLGGTFRVGKRLSLVTESWLFPGDGFDRSQQPFGVGLRFFGERLSVDVGLVLVAEVLDEGFPIPWLSFSYHFGPSRKAANRQATGGFPRAASGRPRHP